MSAVTHHVCTKVYAFVQSSYFLTNGCKYKTSVDRHDFFDQSTCVLITFLRGHISFVNARVPAD